MKPTEDAGDRPAQHDAEARVLRVRAVDALGRTHEVDHSYSNRRG